MIIGIGVDLVNIERIKKAVLKWGDKFLDRVFSKTEKEYCRKFKEPYLHFAARFAAKEAVIKAFGFDQIKNIKFKQIKVVNKTGGAPEVVLIGALKILADKKGMGKIFLSISHDTEYAIAQVVIQRGNK